MLGHYRGRNIPQSMHWSHPYYIDDRKLVHRSSIALEGFRASGTYPYSRELVDTS